MRVCPKEDLHVLFFGIRQVTQIIWYIIHDTQSTQILQKEDGHNTYAIMKTMCPPGYYQNGFVGTQPLGHMTYVL